MDRFGCPADNMFIVSTERSWQFSSSVVYEPSGKSKPARLFLRAGSHFVSRDCLALGPSPTHHPRTKYLHMTSLERLTAYHTGFSSAKGTFGQDISAGLKAVEAEISPDGLQVKTVFETEVTLGRSSLSDLVRCSSG